MFGICDAQRYSGQHDPEDEWGFNPSDIEAAKVIWARDMEQGDQPRLDYFHDRQSSCVPG
jgi:hypothetical protein